MGETFPGRGALVVGTRSTFGVRRETCAAHRRRRDFVGGGTSPRRSGWPRRGVGTHSREAPGTGGRAERVSPAAGCHLRPSARGFCARAGSRPARPTVSAGRIAERRGAWAAELRGHRPPAAPVGTRIPHRSASARAGALRGAGFAGRGARGASVPPGAIPQSPVAPARRPTTSRRKAPAERLSTSRPAAGPPVAGQ